MRTFYMLRNTLAVLTVLAAAAATQAAVTITSSSVDTAGLAGFKTWTLTATSDGAPLQGFDFVGDPTAPVDPATSRGFFGSMNQIVLPTGALVFNDSNALIPLLMPGATAAQDSQFPFTSTSLLVIPGSARETASSLQAAFSTSSNFGQSVAVAQLVLPSTGSANFRGVAGTTDGAEFPVSGTVGGGQQPVAPVVVDVNLGNRLRGSVVTHQFTTSAGDSPITWGNLVVNGPAGGGAPTNAPSLTAGGAFSWDTGGTTALGTWNFDVTATNAGGTDVGRLTINVIPEPATLGLISLAIIGLVGLIRKR
jgi:hypothetical protein